jgi:FAD/FMN-containing dehydrogenase
LVADIGINSGTIASVGYVGWATLGGYGPFSALYGLGADQIVGAKIVNATGELVVANDQMLRGIRGGGGIFGVIVELTIKVYPLKEVSCPSRATSYIPLTYLGSDHLVYLGI